MRKSICLFFLLISLLIHAVNYIDAPLTQHVVDKGTVPTPSGFPSTIIGAAPRQWELHAADDWFAEFFFSPVEWDFAGSEQIVLATMIVGGREFVLSAGRHELIFCLPGQWEATYPVYKRSRRPGMRPDEYRHYVLFVRRGEQMDVFFDGFPFRQSGDIAAPGAMTCFRLGGGLATAFADLRISSGCIGDNDAVRRRYRALYQGKLPPIDFAPPVLSVPKLWEGEGAAVFSGAAVGRMSSIPLKSILHTSTDAFKAGVKAYVAYDSEWLYFRFETAYQGRLKMRHWGKPDSPVWNEESWELFLLPNQWCDYVQFAGNPLGDFSDLHKGDSVWNSGAEYRASFTPERWIGTLAVPLGGKLPGVENGTCWRMNLFNTRAHAGWNRSGSYRDVTKFGQLFFRHASPAVRLTAIEFHHHKLKIGLEFYGCLEKRVITSTLRGWGAGEVEPEMVTKRLLIQPGKTVTDELNLQVPGGDRMTAEIIVYDGDAILLRQNFILPACEDVTR